MSAPGDSRVSRRSPAKSTSPETAENGRADDLPTPSERVREFEEDYPEKADVPVLMHSSDDPREPIKMRRDAVQHYRTEHEGTITEGHFYPITWSGVLRAFLEWFEGVRNLEGKFTDGAEEWTKKFLNSYHKEYLETHYARLMGLHREIVREYENPHTALLSLTASGVDENGMQRGPVDHQLERREAWGPTYKRLYDRMERLVEEGKIEDWMYVIIEEHHPGPFKKNTGYGHDHPVIIADGELQESDFHDVIDTWVGSCEGAEHDAHNYRHPDPEKRPVKIRPIDPTDPGDPHKIQSAGGYLTKYLHPDDGEDPLERDIEQLALQSIKWATNTRRLRKSDRAGHAIKADLCRQKAEDPDDLQELDHGERLTHSEGRGPEIVCEACGSPWGIDAEAGTVVEARRPQETGLPGEPTKRERLANSWKDAPTVARADEDGITEFSRPEKTRLESYIIGEEEYPANASGSVEMVPVVGFADFPLHLSVADRPPP